MKEMFTETIASFSRPSDNPLEMLKTFPPPVTLCFMGAFLALVCGGFGTGALLVKEKSGDNTFSKVPHRCAGLSWTCGLLVAIPSLALGGVLVGISLSLRAALTALIHFATCLKF